MLDTQMERNQLPLLYIIIHLMLMRISNSDSVLATHSTHYVYAYTDRCSFYFRLLFIRYFARFPSNAAIIVVVYDYLEHAVLIFMSSKYTIQYILYIAK